MSGRRRILFVDDEPSDRAILAVVLDRWGISLSIIDALLTPHEASPRHLDHISPCV